MDWDALQALVDKVGYSILAIEMVDGIYEGKDSALDRLVWNLAQAYGEVSRYVGEAVDANKLMQGS